MADPKHRVAGVVAPLALAPQIELLGKIGGRLAGQRRVRGPNPLALLAVTRGARRQPPRRTPFVVERRKSARTARPRAPAETCIVAGHQSAIRRLKPLGDPPHLRVIAPAVRIGLQLPFEITGMKSGEPGGAGAVAAPVESVTSEAGVCRARVRSAESDDSAVLAKPFERSGVALRAARQQESGRDGCGEIAHRDMATRGCRARFRLVAVGAALLLTACKPPPDERYLMPSADAGRGRAAIERAGCGACHTIPGIAWPRGKVGPALNGIAGRAVLAGRLQNRPAVLAAYVRNALPAR